VGRLLCEQTGEVIALRSLHLIGRARECHTRFEVMAVSSLHTMLRWRAGGWEVRDLGSSNGTELVDRVLHGTQSELACGEHFVIGGVTLTLTDDAPPQPFATRADGVLVEGVDGELRLPCGRDEAVVAPGSDGGWILAAPEVIARVCDGDRVRLDGRRWSLSLFDDLRPTWIVKRHLRLSETLLRFEPSGGGVVLSADVAGERIALGCHAWGQLLLVLAQRRQRDRAAGLAEEQQGWWRLPELAEALSLRPGTLNVQLHRARKSLSAQGWIDAEALVERRSEGTIRLGVSDLEIAPG